MTLAIYWNQNIVNGMELVHKLPVHVRTHKKSSDCNQRIRDMHQRTVDVRDRLSRFNHITYKSIQLTSVLDNAPIKQEQYGTVSKTTQAIAASLELESTPN